jgi:adenylylsulfate kinase
VGAAVWFTGLPASGKTTLALALIASLRAEGRVALHLDSDDLRRFFDAGFDDDARDRFYALIGHLAARGAEAGAVVVVSATAHRRAWRDAARAAIPRFIEVFIDAGVETCAARDPKGLWRAAAEGRIRSLPGHGVNYEAPASPEVVVNADAPIAVAVACVRERLASLST